MQLPCSLMRYANASESYADAIREARIAGLILCKYADPIEGERTNISDDDALEIMRQDDTLVYVDIPR